MKLFGGGFLSRTSGHNKKDPEPPVLVESPVDLVTIAVPDEGESPPADNSAAVLLPRAATTTPTKAERKYASNWTTTQQKKASSLSRNVTVREYDIPRGVSTVRSTINLPKLSQYAPPDPSSTLCGPKLVDNLGAEYHAETVEVDFDVMWDRAIVTVTAEYLVTKNSKAAIFVLAIPLDDGYTITHCNVLVGRKEVKEETPVKKKSRRDDDDDDEEEDSGVREFDTALAALSDGKGYTPPNKNKLATAERVDLQMPHVFRMPLCKIKADTPVKTTYTFHVKMPFINGAWQLRIPLLSSPLEPMVHALKQFVGRITYNPLTCTWIGSTVPLTAVKTDSAFVAVEAEKVDDWADQQVITLQFGVNSKPNSGKNNNGNTTATNTTESPKSPFQPLSPLSPATFARTTQDSSGALPPTPATAPVLPTSNSFTPSSDPNTPTACAASTPGTMPPKKKGFGFNFSSNKDKDDKTNSILMYEHDSNGFCTYSLLVVPPPADVPLMRNIVLVVDRSRSMRVVMRQLCATLCSIVRDMRHIDHFGIVVFGATVQAMSNTLKPISSESVAAAVNWLKTNLFEFEDSTNLEKGVRMGIDLLATSNTETGINVMTLITDGATKADNAVYRILSEESLQIKVSTFGIGPYTNSLFLESIAMTTGGTHCSCLSLATLDANLKSLFHATTMPVVHRTEIALTPPAPPASGFPLPSLHAGRPTTCFARFCGDPPTSAKVTGSFARCNPIQEFESNAALYVYKPALHRGLPLIRFLADYFGHFASCTSWLHAANIPETVEFSLNIQFPTPYTVLMGFEPTREERKVREVRHENGKLVDLRLLRLNLSKNVKMLHKTYALGDIAATNKNALTHVALDGLVWRGLSPPWHETAYHSFHKQYLASKEWSEELKNKMYLNPKKPKVAKQKKLNETFGRLALPGLRLMYVEED